MYLCGNTAHELDTRTIHDRRSQASLFPSLAANSAARAVRTLALRSERRAANSLLPTIASPDFPVSWSPHRVAKRCRMNTYKKMAGGGCPVHLTRLI